MDDGLAAAVEAARAYEGLHVNALFSEWSAPLLDAVDVTAGRSVLDVACGTGVVARAAQQRVGPSGRVTGLDIGPGMLAVAEELEPAVRWVQGDATALPFDDDDFDAVVSSFGLMFFPDRAAAIGEMLRCVRPTGAIAVAVWDALERSAAYSTAVELLGKLAGEDAADALRAPFSLGDPDDIAGLFEQAGASEVSVATRPGTARFPSVQVMMEAELRGWLPIMGVELDEELIQQILDEAEQVLAEHVTSDGSMEFATHAHIATARPA